MKKLMTICLVLFVAGTALADWMPGDPCKMHFAQLPDPYGWDVAFDDWQGNQYPLADDWKCTGTGPVDDIHLWVSWQGDRVSQISALAVKIYSNIPAGPQSFSTPGNLLWGTLLYPDMINYGTGDQGWFDPFKTSVILPPPDHHGIWQLNINDIDKPFIQQEGEIYWLVVEAWWVKENTTNPEWPGWKTSMNNWGDDAVYWDGSNWQELKYPENDPLNRGGESIDLAFVITPEPATICLLGLGALSLIRRKK
jgi:hypothetical protein